eukprot:g2456.t1
MIQQPLGHLQQTLGHLEPLSIHEFPPLIAVGSMGLGTGIENPNNPFRASPSIFGSPLPAVVTTTTVNSTGNETAAGDRTMRGTETGTFSSVADGRSSNETQQPSETKLSETQSGAISSELPSTTTTRTNGKDNNETTNSTNAGMVANLPAPSGQVVQLAAGSIVERRLRKSRFQSKQNIISDHDERNNTRREDNEIHALPLASSAVPVSEPVSETVSETVGLKSEDNVQKQQGSTNSLPVVTTV